MKEITLQVPDGKRVEWKEVNGQTVPVLVDEETKDNRPVTERVKTLRVKTFEDALEELGEDNQLVKEYWAVANVKVELSADIMTYLKLRIIVAALNEGWEPKFEKGEYRYYPWFYLYTKEQYDELDDEVKGRCVLRSGYDTSSYTGVGSRLAFRTRELAAYAGRQFIEEWADFMFKPRNGESRR